MDSLVVVVLAPRGVITLAPETLTLQHQTLEHYVPLSSPQSKKKFIEVALWSNLMCKKVTNGPPLTCGPQVIVSNPKYIYQKKQPNAQQPDQNFIPAYNFRCFVAPSTLSASSEIPLFLDDSVGIGMSVGMLAASVPAAFDSFLGSVEQRGRDSWPSRASRRWTDSRRWTLSYCSSWCMVRISCSDSLVLRSWAERCS